PWTRHASGLLVPPDASPPGGPLVSAGTSGPLVSAAPPVGTADFTLWPPEGAVAVETAGFYAAMAAGGYDYGPSFRGLRAAWQRGADVFAEVALPPEAAADAGLFGLHPA